MYLNYLEGYLTREDLVSIQEKISGIENSTFGEIRLCLKKKRRHKEKKFNTKEFALLEFHKLEMQNTLHKTGILVLVIFTEKVFEIIADEGINNKIPQGKWDEISAAMSGEFRNGNYKNGILNCLNAIGEILIKEFPSAGERDTNELSDEVIVE